MYILSIINVIGKLAEKRLLCAEVNDKSLSEEIYHSSLLLGLHGYRNYTQACEMLKINKSYLYHLISKHKEEIGEPFHLPILGQAKWLSVYQIEIIEKILLNGVNI